MKGISLPIEMIIILSISVIVLLSVAAFFASGFFKQTDTMSHTSAWNQACGIIKGRGCYASEDLSSITISNYMLSSGVAGTALDACRNALSYTRSSDCVNACCNPGAIRSSATTITDVPFS